MGILFAIAVLALLGFWAIIERSAIPKGMQDSTLILLYITQISALFSMIIENIVLKREFGILSIAGILFLITGILVRQLSIRHLGRHFTYEVKVQKNHKLITSGPYHYVMHPLYTGIIIMWLGLAIAFQSVSGAAIILLLVFPALAIRISKEEKAMRKEFGKKYETYSRKTKRLIPFTF